MRHGWYSIPGIQTGDRTLEQQLEAVKPALDDCVGKLVLDIGCAEGLMSKAFAEAGARHVVGVDVIQDHIDIARAQCSGMSNVYFMNQSADADSTLFGRQHYDIVLALGVAHKSRDPGKVIMNAARSSGGLVLLRCGQTQTDGIVRSKRNPDGWCDTHAMLREQGFELEKVVPGPAPINERVEYWRRHSGWD